MLFLPIYTYMEILYVFLYELLIVKLTVAFRILLNLLIFYRF